MSAVINKAKQDYLRAIKIALAIFLLSAVVVFMIQSNSVLPFILGGSVNLIAHCVFVYWIFYFSAKKTQQLTAFYKGEALKWAVTIILFIVMLKTNSATYSTMNFLVFFLGFFLMLMCNSLLPFVLAGLKQKANLKTN